VPRYYSTEICLFMLMTTMRLQICLRKLGSLGYQNVLPCVLPTPSPSVPRSPSADVDFFLLFTMSFMQQDEFRKGHV
jgi:hypothetical protein